MIAPRRHDQVLIDAVEHFRRAAAGTDPAANALYGLAEILMAVRDAFQGSASPGVVAELEAAMSRATAPVIEDAGHAFSFEEIGIGMGAAAGLLRLFGNLQSNDTPEMLADRLDYAAVLAAQLVILERRRAMERRGNVLRRSVAIADARNQPRQSGQPLH